jgi:tetratricopeptide (TPR) repeat protein
LSKKSSADFAQNKAYQLEFTYRLGRIHHKLNHFAEAANLYQQTVNEGKNEVYYFACNAAFQLGFIYEQQGNKSLARNYYNLCLDMNPTEYSSSVHQKAKAGLSRVN